LDNSKLKNLLETHKKGFALSQPFYCDNEVFDLDVKSIFFHEWLFAGHVSELQEPGDYFLFQILNESVIVSRDFNKKLHAMVNVCRHRGSRVCLEKSGNTKRFTCPYHAWTYNLDGSLFNARLIEPDIDRSELGLQKLAVEVFHGLIFISFSDKPDDMTDLKSKLDPILSPFELSKTKVAFKKSYRVKANWKVLIENYSECYHCSSAHPEFSKSHVTHMSSEKAQPLNALMEKRAKVAGVPTDFVDCIGVNRFDGQPDYAYNRYSLYDGYDTGSEDGMAVGPLLGNIKEYDGGASDLYIGLLNPFLIYCDYVAVYRFIPIDKDTSIQEIIWLVRDNADLGSETAVDRLKWLWDVTTVSDKCIIEKNQEGINSRYYKPGPFSSMEKYTRLFVDFYLERLGSAK
jgi:phenylpropionate dioxygenase-like ring-hydroxylating dioxygenase large terminal subunit